MKRKIYIRSTSCQAAALFYSQFTPEGIRALRQNVSTFKIMSMYLNATAESFDDDAGNLVGAGIAGGTAVLEVTLAILGNLARDTDAATTVGNAVGELVDAASLVTASKTLLVALTVNGNVFVVAGLKLLHVALNDLHATVGTRGSSRNVAVETSSVPVTLDGLGIEGNPNAKFFSDAAEEEAGQPKVVTHYKTHVRKICKLVQEIISHTLNTIARANLVLPLGGHHLGVDAGDLHASV
jgi:hypothetical protein